MISFFTSGDKIIMEVAPTHSPTASPTGTTEEEGGGGEGAEERRRVLPAEGVPKWQDKPKARSST